MLQKLDDEIISFCPAVEIAALSEKEQREDVYKRQFMKGKDGKTLEESMKEKYAEVDTVLKVVKQNRLDIREINRRMEKSYQKLGIVKYDAFNEMGGKLSFRCV